ncbi:N-acetyltransferase [Salmonella enterica subsp. enterica]|nr:N-acetyltransferase [Salmonella enterica subsp. enterica serovar Enteritidis]
MHPAYLLRPATLDDAEAIARLVNDAYAKWEPVIGRKPMPMTVDYRQAVGRNDFALLFDQEQLVGLIEAIRQDDCIWIENVAVTPDRQGAGIGQRLLAHAEELAKTAGRKEVRLLTNADFKSNVTFYRKFGYAVSHVEPFMGGQTVYMVKRLADAGPSAAAPA